MYDDSSDWHTVSSSVGTDERVEDLKDVEAVAYRERMDAQYNGEDVGWSSLAEETVLQAPPGVTDEELQQYMKANYDADALAKLQAIFMSNTQVTDAGCAALAAALGSGALPALDNLNLCDTRLASAAAISAVYAARDGLCAW